MESLPLDSEDKGADCPADPNLQVLAHSHSCTIGSLSATTVGGDLHIQYITEAPCLPQPTGSKETIQTQRETILAWLDAPTFDVVYASALEQRMPETGSWFLEFPDFQKFMGSKGVTLWCTGMPGAGKTILASIAVNHLWESIHGSPHTALAFAFLRYSERYAWRDILKSLLVQLIRRSDLACATFWPHYSLAASKATSEVIILESGLETALCDIAGKLEKLYVVIDGLDEAIDEVKDRLLETLVPSGVNLLILSRPLELYIHHSPDALFVSIQAQTKDIELYVHGEVQRSSRLRSIFEGKPEKIAELCEKISKQSDGMFLVARLQMGAITRSSKSIASLFRNLQALPAGVNAMYDHTLGRIRDSEDSSIAFRAFAWITYAHEEITESGCLQHALSFDPETQSFDADDVTPMALILSACQGLVTLGRGSWDSTVRFIHYTTYEYMKSVELDGLSNPHSLLALTCLACMEDGHERLLDLRRSDSRRLRSYIFGKPLLGYSHSHWADHVRLSQPPDSVYPFIYPYLSKHAKHPSYTEPDGRGMEIVSGAHLIAIYGLIGGFDIQSAQGLLPNIKSEPNGYTPFHFAAMRGQFETFRLLLSLYSGVNLRSLDGRTVLHFAVHEDQTSFIQQLYSLTTIPREEKIRPEVFSFNVNAQDSRGETPLMIASRQGDVTLVQLFSSCEGVDFNIQDNEGRSALHHSTRQPSDSFETLEIIQGRDAVSKMICSLPHVDVNLRDKEGDSPFMSACYSGLEETVKYLLARGDGSSLVHQTNKRGRTALMMVCNSIGQRGREPHQQLALTTILNLLITHGSNWRAQDVDGMTPFLCVVEQREKLSFGGHPTAHHRPMVMEQLLALDPTLIDQCDSCGRTALILAVREDDVPSVDWILARRGYTIGYVNAQDRDRMTALFHACRQGFAGVVAALLMTPCINIHHQCSRGLSAVDWLFRMHHPGKGAYETLGLLMKAGEWDPSRVRKVALRAFAHVPVNLFNMTDGDFLDLWCLVSDSFIWSLDENDTVVFLVLASRRPCRIPVALVLHSLGLLPRGSFGLDLDKMEDTCHNFNYPPYKREHERLIHMLRIQFLAEEGVCTDPDQGP